MLDTLLTGNSFKKYAFAVLIVFGPLYLLSSYGNQWADQVALIIFVSILIYAIGKQGYDFKGNVNPIKAAQ